MRTHAMDLQHAGIHRDGARVCRAHGFTLIELVFVVGLIIIILAIAMPRLMPVFAFSQLEGAARHIANYGRSAIAFSAFSQEPITFRFDFATGEYFALRWVEKEDESIFEGSKLAVENSQFKLNAETVMQLANQEGLTPEDRALQIVEFQRQLDLAFRKSLEARANNVPREGMLSEIDPLADFEFSLDEDEEELREEIMTSTLGRTALPEGVSMMSIRVGVEEFIEGLVDIEITPVGLTEEVVFKLQGSDGDLYSVAWDPITGGAHLSQSEDLPL